MSGIKRKENIQTTRHKKSLTESFREAFSNVGPIGFEPMTPCL